MSINNRIQYIRKSLKMNQAEFGKVIGVSRDVIANIEGERVVPKDLLIFSICKEYNVNEDWLRTGSGEPFIERSAEDQISAWVGRVLQNRDESTQKRILRLLSQLDDTDWKALDALLAKACALLNGQD